MKLIAGDLVGHATLGLGRIVTEWGSWYACWNCFDEMDVLATVCKTCHAKGSPKLVSGKGVFDVKFGDGKVHSINKCRLLTNYCRHDAIGKYSTSPRSHKRKARRIERKALAL